MTQDRNKINKYPRLIVVGSLTELEVLAKLMVERAWLRGLLLAFVPSQCQQYYNNITLVSAKSRVSTMDQRG